MKYCQLQSTDLKVSNICLGTANFGIGPEEAEAGRQMDLFVSQGGNFLDTAHVYSDWIPGERNRSERVIGRWLKQSGKRNQVIISTKGAHPPLENMAESRVRLQEIRKDLEESLEALQTDYIDLYFLHRDDPDMPAAELLGALEEARRQGKIRFYGCSNWTLPRMLEADKIAKQEGYSGFVCDQIMWSLADINQSAVLDPTLVIMSQEIFDYHQASGKSVMAYTSAAHGYLSKKHNGAAIPEGLRRQYDNAQNEEILKLIQEYDIPVSEFSFAYLMNQEFAAVPIVSFRTMQQLEEGIKSCDLTVPAALMEEIRKVKKHSC